MLCELGAALAAAAEDFGKNQDHPRFPPISWCDGVLVFHPAFVLEDLPYASKLKLEAVALACRD